MIDGPNRVAQWPNTTLRARRPLYTRKCSKVADERPWKNNLFRHCHAAFDADHVTRTELEHALQTVTQTMALLVDFVEFGRSARENN